jgi:putative transposase
METICYKYRIYPNKEQAEYLEKTFGAVRFIYNWAIEQKENRYKYFQKAYTPLDLQAKLTFIRRTEELSWLSGFFINTLQSALQHNNESYQRFFKKLGGKPKFKSRKHSYQSFCVPNRYTIKNGKVKLPMMKSWIKIKLSRVLPDGIMKSCTISRDKDKYFISINFTVEKQDLIEKTKVLAVGVDLNLENLATLSDGKVIKRFSFTKLLSKRLAIRQRKLSRSKKGSNNRLKQKTIVQKVHTKIANKRKDYLHKESKKLVDNYDIFVFEKLQILNMVKNHKLAKSISDVSWGIFKQFVKYKAKNQGKQIVEVAPHHTSQDCSVCKYRNRLLTLADRNWVCPVCNTQHDRDGNAATNILYKWYNTAGSAEIQASGANIRLSVTKQPAMKEEAFATVLF